MAAITHREKANLYFPYIKHSLTEEDMDRWDKMSRWDKLTFIIERYQALKLDEIRRLREKLKNESRKYERGVIREQIVERMDELHGKKEPSRTTTVSEGRTGSMSRGVHFR